MMKTLENRLKEKVGQTVQKLDIISQEFIVVLVTGLKTLDKFRCCQMATGNENYQ